MPDIDNLSIKIKAESDTANKALTDLISNLNKMTSALQSVGKVQGFSKIDDFAKRTSQTFESISKQFEGLGKGYQIKGDFSQVTKGLNTLENNLSKAIVKEEELRLGGKTDTTGYENAVKDIVKYQNMIDSVKASLSEMEKPINEGTYKIHTMSGEFEVVDGKIHEITQSAAEMGQVIQNAVSIPYKNDLAGIGVPLPDLDNLDKIDTEKATEKMKELHQTLTMLRVPDVLETDIDKLNSSFDKTKQKLEGLKAEFQNALTMGKITESPDDKGYVKFRETIAKTGMELSALSQRIKEVKVQNEGLKTERLENFYSNLQKLKVAPVDETNLDKLTESLEKAEKELEKLKLNLQNGLTMGKVSADIDNKGWRDQTEQIALAEKRVEALRARIAEIKAPPLTHLLDSIKQFPHMVADVFKNIPYLATKGIGAALKGAANIGIKAFQTLGKVGMSALKGIGNLAGKIGSKFASMLNPFKKLTSASKGMNVSLAGGFKTVLKYAFGIRSLFTLFNKLRNAVKEGMKNLVQYSDETNASVSMLTNSMTQLKNSVAAAVSPLLNALAPALDFIVQMCIKAVNAINQLISALLGKATWIHAKKLTDSYRDSLNGASKAAEKLQKGVRAFDELNLITTPDDNDGGSGAGTSAADMFETLDVEKPFSDLAERIKEMWEKADFTELGAMVGGKIKAGLESIDWGTIQGNVARVGKSLATFINGLVEVEGLGYTVGTSIGEGFNTALIAVNTFLDNTHWDSIGTFIGEGLNGIVDTVDWGGIGHMFAQKWNALFETLANTVSTFDWSNLGKNLSDGFVTFIEDLDTSYIGESISGIIKGLLDTIIAFVENTDWKKLGNTVADKIGDFVNSIDWSGIADRLFEAIGAVLGGLAAFLWGIIEDAWQNVVDWWYDTAYEDGEFTMKGLLEGIWNKIKDIGTWIKEHIFQPFIDGFKKAFGIASPSKVMEEQGNFIMEGLFNGISALVDKVVGIFGDIKTKISEKWNEVKTNTTQTWDSIKSTVSGKWDELKTKASTTWNNIGTAISSKWSEVQANTSQAWAIIGAWVGNAWENMKTSVFNGVENVKSFVFNAWNNIQNFTSNIWSNIMNIISGVAQSISNIVSGIFDKIGQIKDKVSDFTDSVKNINVSTPSFLTGGVGSLVTNKIKGYATGGFIENPHSYSLFMAGENGIPEMLGTVGGQPAVVGGQEITGISDTIRSETERQNELLRQQNQLLQELLRKDFGITKDEIGQAARDYSREYFDKNGKPAFAY